MKALLEFGVIHLNGRAFNLGLLIIIIALLGVSMFICIRISKKYHLYEKKYRALDPSDQRQ